MKDRQGRNINYLRISVTDRCNLRCSYCMPETGVEKKEHGDMLSLEEVFEVAAACVDLGINKIRITGGEPLVRKGVVGLINKLSKLKGVKDIAMTTNGVLLKDFAYELKEAGLHRVNISLDTLKPERYAEITRFGRLEDVLTGINEARKAGLVPIKLNTVLIGGFNDDEIEDFVRLTENEELDVRFIELMPVGQAAAWTKDRFVSNAKVLEAVKELIPIGSTDPCSPATYYTLPEAKGKVGLINPISHMFCGSCNRIRLTADGKLKPCLHSNQELDVKNILRGKGDVKGLIRNAIIEKPNQHEMCHINYTPIERDMFRIGG